MLKNKNALYFMLGFMLVLGAGFWTISQAQQNSGQEKQVTKVLRKGDLKGKDKKDIPPPSQREIDDAVTPIVDYANVGSAVDTDRKMKNSRFNNSNFVKKDVLPGVDTISKNVPIKSSDLPAGDSDVILEGKVLESRAFLSDDGSGVYSEFVIGVSEVVKTNPNLNISNGGTIIGQRFGGRVKYPSGKIVRYNIIGLGTPAVGKNYLFFLRNMGAGTFSILTGYAFKGNKVFPLDGSRVTGIDFGSSKFDKHNGEDINKFKENVGKAMRGEYK